MLRSRILARQSDATDGDSLVLAHGTLGQLLRPDLQVLLTPAGRSHSEGVRRAISGTSSNLD